MTVSPWPGSGMPSSTANLPSSAPRSTSGARCWPRGITLHREFQRDSEGLIRSYDEIGGRALGDGFFADLTARLALIGAQPRRFPPWRGEIRRGNRTSLSCHILFRVTGGQVRVLVQARDHYAVTGVSVAVKDAAGVTLEQGMASAGDGAWR